MTSFASETDPRLRADLRAMVGDGVAFSVMVGIGESYLPAFALALGLGDVHAGLIATLPMLAGALLQLVTPAAVGWLGSHKRWVVLCAALQAATFVPLVAAALAGEITLALLYLTASLYWGLGMATGPAWNTWVGTIVPPRRRTRFFATRAGWCHLALFVALLAGGGVLQWSERAQALPGAYALLFGTALVARAVSARFLARQSERRPVPLGETRISPRVIGAHVRSGGHGRLLVYLLVFQSAVWIAAPFFAPYMLGPLGLEYLEFTLLTATAFLARVLALPALGRFAHRAGTRRLLWLGSFGIVPLPALWLVSDAFTWLLALQVLSGAAWAAFELATLLSFFEHIPEHGRTSILSVFNLANALAIAVGSALGAGVLSLVGSGAEGYVALLAVSAMARLLALPLLRGMADVVPEAAEAPPLRTLSVRPAAGALQRPVTATLEEEGALEPPRPGDADASAS